jgi:hypothetical protein
MHYKGDADKFLKKMGVGEAEVKPKLSITSSSLPASTQIVVLSYA